MQKSVPVRTRDRSLDVVRVAALLLMVTAHWGRTLSDTYHMVNIMQFVAELATVLFFFSFGMTLDYFLGKPLQSRMESHLKLFVLSVVHSLYGQGTPFYSDFFMFLFASRALFDVLVRVSRASRQLIGIFLAAMCVAWVALPAPVSHRFFEPSFPGWFPIFPWILFVAAGYLFSHHRTELRTSVIALLGIAVGLASFYLLGQGLSKWPLSPNYALLFSSLTVAAFLLLDRIRWPEFLPWRTIEMLSVNLLMATALHYVVVALAILAHREIAPLLTALIPPKLIPLAFSTEYVGMSALAVALLVLAVRGFVAMRAWLGRKGASGIIEDLFPAMAVMGIVLYAGALHLYSDARQIGLFLMCAVAFFISHKRA